MKGQEMVQTVQSGLMKKYGAKLDGAVKAHASDPIVERGFRNAPSGITDGKAKLTECFFECYTKDTVGDQKMADGKSAIGEYVFRATGVLTEDFENDDGVSTKGITVRIGSGWGIPVYDTKWPSGEVVSFDDHVKEVLNELKLLGVDTEGATGADLEGLAAAAQEAAPFFKFTTRKASKPNKNGEYRTYENWNGVKGLEDYVPPSDTQDDTGTVNPTKSTSEKQTNTAATQSGSPSKTSAAVGQASLVATESDVPFGDELDDLAVDCASEDTDEAADATEKMAKYAVEVGVNHEDEQYADWAAVAQAIRDARAAGGADSNIDDLAVAADDGDQYAADKLDEIRQSVGISDDDYNSMGWTDLAEAIKVALQGDTGQSVEVGQVFGYKLLNPTTRKQDAKATDCEVLSVADDKVTLKNLTTGKTVIDSKTKRALQIPVSELTS